MIKERTLYYYKTYEINGANFFPLTVKKTGLPVDIQVDNNMTFSFMEHPVWIYFRNSYDNNSNEWIPLVVSKQPYLPYPNKRIKITNEDFEEIIDFVYEFRRELKALALSKISTISFIRLVNEYKQSLNEGVIIGNRHLNEMSVLQKWDSRLPLRLWIDNTGSWKKSQHNERLKVENPFGEDKTDKWMPIILTGEVRVAHPDKMDKKCKKHIKEVLAFVNKYKEDIISITRGQSDIDDLIDKVDRDYQNSKTHPYEVIKDAKFGYTIVKNDEDLYNYVNEEGKLLSDKWFDMAGVFQQRKNNEVSAYVEIDNDVLYLTIEGKLID